MIKKAAVGILFLFLFSGCFEANFNFKTVVHRNGKFDREVQINGRGADRFLPPSGSEWQVKSSETKGGESILKDTQYHIYATGHFIDASRFSSDFRYDVPDLISNLTDQTREELRGELGIPEPLEQQIGTENQIELKRKKSLFTTNYDYTEVFHIRWVIPILLHDLKKEIIRDRMVSLKAQAAAPEVNEASGSLPKPAVIEPELLAPAKVEELALKKMKEEILPKFQFHSEVTLPGRIISSNAVEVHGKTGIWDFNGTVFEGEHGVYTLHITSSALNKRALMLALLLFFIIIVSFVFSRRGKTKKGPASR